MASQKSTNTTNEQKSSSSNGRTQRRKRVPLGGPNRRLSIPDHMMNDPNYRYYWFNDVQDRIQRALAAGYEFVDRADMKGEGVGDPDVHNNNSATDSRVYKSLRGQDCYLMRIPMEFFLEDQAAKEAAADSVDEAIFGSDDKVPNSYGLDVKYRR